MRRARRFIFEGEASKKFWEIELSGDHHRVTFGRLGTAGQTKTKRFGSSALAAKDHARLIASKRAKGYVEVGDEGDGGSVAGLTAALARVERWMSEHARFLVENLAAGASSTHLDALEKVHSTKIPSEVRELWSAHDGQKMERPRFIPGLEFLSSETAFLRCSDVQRAVDFCREVCRNQPDAQDEAGITNDELASDAWLPLATLDSDGLVVSGITGRVFSCVKDAPPLRLAARSTTEWFETYASELESGHFVQEDGELERLF